MLQSKTYREREREKEVKWEGDKAALNSMKLICPGKDTASYYDKTVSLNLNDTSPEVSHPGHVSDESSATRFLGSSAASGGNRTEGAAAGLHRPSSSADACSHIRT